MLAKLINLNNAQIIVLPNGQAAYPQFQAEDSDDEMEQDSDDEVPQFYNGLQSLMEDEYVVIKASELKKLQGVKTVKIPTAPKITKIAKKTKTVKPNKARCDELNVIANTDPRFTSDFKFRFDLQSEVEKLMCWAMSTWDSETIYRLKN